MNIEYQLKRRTAFIRYFYNNAVIPFESIISLIEKEKEPYIPPYSEDPEPAFLNEWIESQTGIEAIGHTCISMLTSSLNLFLKSWVDRLEKKDRMKFKFNSKKGWFNGYIAIFKQLELPLSKCDADLEIIEQIILSRNRIQHPEKIWDLTIQHSKKDLKKFPNPFFIQKDELVNKKIEDDGNLTWWFPPSIKTSKGKIFKAIDQVEALCSWLENQYWMGGK